MKQTAGLAFTEADLLTSIPVRFRRVLEHLPPDQLACVSSDEQHTYLELAAASRALAAELVAGLGAAAARATQKAVALLLPPHSMAALAGIMGVLEAGHFYVPLDFALGEATLRQILLDCPPAAVVTVTALQEQLKSILPAEQHPAVVGLDSLAPSQAPLAGAPDVDGLMYASVLYTAGSTGKPRGVICTHALNLYASYLAHCDFGFKPGDRTSHLRSYAHASSTQPIFGGLLNGATLHALPGLEVTPTLLYQWIAEREITHLHVSLGLLRSLAELAATQQPLASLRVIITGGEALHRADVERIYRVVPATCKFVARLVSTEATVYARFVVEPGSIWQGSQIPAGHVPPGCQVTIVDENHQPVPSGQPGEIAVRSRFLAAGYWQRPAETAAHFLPDPEGGEERVFLTGDLGRLSANGLLEHLGRTDFMVKVRGYRVQPEAVEAALIDLDEVAEAVVVTRATRSGEQQLIAYLVPAARPYPIVSTLRDALLARLPDYMVPSRFVLLEKLPRNTAGKVDRAALPPCGRARPELRAAFVAPRNALEEQIADIWAELLELDEVGVDDNFFALGGDSILAMRMLLRIEPQLGQAAAPTFFRQPTVAYLAGERAVTADAGAGAAAATQAKPPRQANRHRPWRARVVAPLRRFMEKGPLRGDRAVLPYGIGTRMQRALVAQPAVQRLFARELDALERWQAELGAPHGAQTRHISLLANTWLWWRQRSLADPSVFAAWVSVSGPGWSWVEREPSSQGVVLVVPHVSSSLVPLEEMLRLRGRETARVVNDRSLQHTGDKATWEAQQTPARTAQLWQARQVLQRGGIVLIAGDGWGGQRTVDVPFLGRWWPFQVGAATLAVETDALFVPVWVGFDAASRVHMEVAAPLAAYATPQEERITELTRQYGQIFAARWPEYFASVRWRLLTRALDLPAA